MSRGKRPQYLSIDLKPKGASVGYVTVCGPSEVVSRIKNNCNKRDCGFEQMGSTAKLTIYGDCQLIKASFVEYALGAGFTPSSDKGDSLVFSRNVILFSY